VGKSRARAILINLLLPAFAAMGAPADAWKTLLDHLPAEESNELIQQTALRLFGPDHTPRLYRSGLRRQGLIQIHHDYCLGDRSLCAACPFPAQLAALNPMTNATRPHLWPPVCLPPSEAEDENRTSTTSNTCA
jgi:hypothetical protein